MLIEDVACPVDKLADMTVDLVEMFQKFGYKDASCFGHALEGNLHLVFSQVEPHALLRVELSLDVQRNCRQMCPGLRADKMPSWCTCDEHGAFAGPSYTGRMCFL